MSEPHGDVTTSMERGPSISGGSVAPTTDPSRKSGEALLNLPTSAIRTKDIQNQLREISQQLRELSDAVTRTHQDVSGQFATESARIKALDEKLQTISMYWKELDNSRRVGKVNALYYTWVAMLGLGDFGPQSPCGKIVVAVAGLWGVLAFGMVTALLVAAVKRYYNA